MIVQPGKQPVHGRACGLQAQGTAAIERARLVQLLEALVHVAEPTHEGDGGQRQSGAAFLAEGLGQRVGRAGQDVVERLDPGGRGIERGHHRGPRRFRPRGLGDGVLEERPLGSEAREDGRGRARVAVERQVIAAQRVRPDEDDALRPLAVASGRGQRVVDDGRAPEPERPGSFRRERQDQTHFAAGETVQAHLHGVPAVRCRHGALRDHLLGRAGPRMDGNLEGHGAGLERADRELQPRMARQLHVEPQRIRRSSDERLAVDLAQALPTQAPADAGQVLPAGDHPHGLDLERRSGCVRRANEEMTRGHRDRCRRVQDVGPHLGTGHDGSVERPGNGRLGLGLELQVDVVGVAEEHRQVRAGRRAHSHLDLVEDVAVVRAGPAQVDDRDRADRAAGEVPVLHLQALDTGTGRPGRPGRR